MSLSPEERKMLSHLEGFPIQAKRLSRKERKLLKPEEIKLVEEHFLAPRRPWEPGGGTVLLVVTLWTVGLVLALVTGAGWWIFVASVVATVLIALLTAVLRG
jgi:hypothetical protein